MKNLDFNKIGILADLHFGRKANAKYFLEQLENYLYNEFLPKNKNSDAIFILGDLWENRRTVNVVIFHAVLRFINTVTKTKPCFLFMGNHDLYFSNSFDNNLLTLLSAETNDNLFIIDDFQKIKISGQKCLLCPYITKNNYEEFKKHIKTKYDYIFGHFNILDFYEGLSEIKINEMKKHSEEFSITDFKVNKALYSGHIHFYQQKSFITYIGSPVQYSFAHVNKKQGGLILDIKTNKTKFIKNKIDLYYKFVIEDQEKFDFVKTQIKEIKNKLVKIYFTDKTPEKIRRKVEDYFTLMSGEFYFFDIIDIKGDDYDDEQLSEAQIKNTISEDNIFTFIDEILATFDRIDDKERIELKKLFSDLFVESKQIIEEKNKNIDEEE